MTLFNQEITALMMSHGVIFALFLQKLLMRVLFYITFCIGLTPPPLSATLVTSKVPGQPNTRINNSELFQLIQLTVCIRRGCSQFVSNVVGINRRG